MGGGRQLAEVGVGQRQNQASTTTRTDQHTSKPVRRHAGGTGPPPAWLVSQLACRLPLGAGHGAGADASTATPLTCTSARGIHGVAWAWIRGPPQPHQGLGGRGVGASIGARLMCGRRAVTPAHAAGSRSPHGALTALTRHGCQPPPPLWHLMNAPAKNRGPAFQIGRAHV